MCGVGRCTATICYKAASLDSLKGPLVYVVNIVYSLFKRILFRTFKVETDTPPKLLGDASFWCDQRVLSQHRHSILLYPILVWSLLQTTNCFWVPQTVFWRMQILVL